MKINAFDSTFPFLVSLGQTTLDYSTGSNSAEGDLSGGGDVVGSPGDYVVVGLRDTVSLASNIGGVTLGDVLTIVQASPSIAMFATPSNSGVSFGSNATRVSETASVGALATAAREDHIHDGIGTVTASSSNTMQRGTLNLRPGTNVAFGLTDTDGDGEHDTLTITASAAGGGGVTLSDATPQVESGSGSAGTAGTASRGDHVHPAAGGSADDPVADIFGTPDTAYEFSSSSMTGLTAIGTATAEDADTTVPGHYYVAKAATSSVALTGRYAAASAPFTAIAKLSDHSLNAANYVRIGGLFVGQATPGAIEAIHLLHNGDWQVSHVRYSSPTAYSATVGSDIVTKFAAVPIYYAIVVNSTSDIDLWFSFGGRTWRKRTDARNPSITIGSVGVVVDPENASIPAVGAYDYLRIWNSVLTPPGL